MSIWVIHVDEDGDVVASSVSVKDQAPRIHHSEDIPCFIVDSGASLVEALRYEGPRQGNVHRAAKWLIDKIERKMEMGPAGRDVVKQVFKDGSEVYRLRFQMEKVYVEREAAMKAAARHKVKRDALAQRILDEKESSSAGIFTSYVMHEVDHVVASVMPDLLIAYLNDDRSLMGQWFYSSVDEALALLLEAGGGQESKEDT